jgi:ATP-dependent helicase/nuclease subunit A
MSVLTNTQQLAVETRGNVLVVAGAGTGKTSTLVKRCVDRIVNEDASLDRILMVTFTDAAAAEMRHRIGEELAKAASLGTSRHIEEQLALIDSAQISTLSSFCLELVREHFHELEIDPQAIVLDDERLAPLIEETLDTLFDEFYTKNDERSRAVQSLVRQYGNGSDFTIRKLVLKIHRYTQSLARPRQWFDEQIGTFDEPGPLKWRAWLRDGIREWRALWFPALEAVAPDVPAIATCARALWELDDDPPLEKFFSALEGICRADADNKLWNRKKTALRPKFATFFKEAAFLIGLQPHGESDSLAYEWNCVRNHMLALLDLACEFGKRFATAKRESGGLDFADIEQLALKLLTADSRKTTPVAEAIRSRFDHVFVDEYQDINEAQDWIIQAVSRNEKSQSRTSGTDIGGNRFLVGDVKQSIYRFRLAQPRIFAEYDARWNNSVAGSRIPLSENFRSREAILNFINPLFAALMRRSIGGLDYPEDARLAFGNRREREHFTAERDGGLCRVELHLIAKTGDNAGNNAGDDGGTSELLDLEAVEREARLIANRLRELCDSRLIVRERTGEEHPVEYRDMVVLMRSPSDRIEAFAKQFHKLGVPLRAARAGFYQAAEVSDLLCLLRLLDNPLQDIPLLAVLRSPLVALSAEELVEVRCAGIEGGWWAALNRFRARGTTQAAVEASRDFSALSAWSKVDAFVAQFERWRELMPHGSVSQILETVLAETHYESLLAGDSRGPERLANVRRFVDLARDYDPLRRQGFYRFLRFIDAQRAADVDREPAPVQAGNAVQLMSIHRSKGLEFPVVVLANLGGTFNEQGLNEAILISEQFGLCPKVCPPERHVIYPSLPHWLARRTERRELLGEEMRLFYVALTRAKEMLILTGTAPRKDLVAPWKRATRRTIGDVEILNTHSYLGWLSLWLPQITSDAHWANDREGSCALLRWKLYDANDDCLLANAAIAGELPAPDETSGVSTALARLEKPYNWAAATMQVAKSSVSVLRHGEEDEDAQPMFFRRDWSKRSISSSKLSARDIGTAHHRFQQFVAFDKVTTLEDLYAEAQRMTGARLIDSMQAETLRLDQLHRFWISDAGRQIQKHAGNVRRELEFTARLTPRELADLGFGRSEIDDDFIVIQGVADLVVLLPDEIWLLDFKTDDITESEADQRAAFHARQLSVYARALEGIYGKKVTRCWLHFFAIERTMDVSFLPKILNAGRPERV